MLKGLDDIEWSRLTHAYGAATDVPVLITSLISPDEDQRCAALQELFTNIWHQGTIYDASVQALPFLIELLNAPGDLVPDRESVALLVASIIAGTGYCQVHYATERINPFTRQPLPRPSDLTERLAQELVVVREVRQRGTPAIPFLLPYLRNDDAYVRSTVAKALGCYPGSSSVIKPALLKALTAEQDHEVRVAIEAALHALAPDPV